MVKVFMFFIVFKCFVSISQTQINEIVPPIYSEIKKVNEEFFLLENTDSLTYLDIKNRKIYNTYYRYIFLAKNNISVAINDSNRYFHVDSTGQPIYLSKYETSSNYINGIAIVGNNEYRTLIDKKGKEIFSRRDVEFIYFNHDFVLYQLKNKRFLEDYNKNIIFQGDIKTYGGLVYIKTLNTIKFLTKTGFIKNEYEYISQISPKFYSFKRNGINGILNNDFKEIVQFDEKIETSDIGNKIKNDSILFLIKNKKWALFDVNKGIKTGFEYDKLEYLNKNLIIATIGIKKGIINTEGIVISDFIWESITRIKDSDNWISVSNDYQNKNIIDYEGNILFKPKNIFSGFTQCTFINDSLFIIKKDTHFGIINNRSEIVAPFEYDEIEHFKNGYGRAVKIHKTDGEVTNLEHGLLNINGDFYGTQSYCSNIQLKNGYIVMQKKPYYSVIDSAFNNIIPFSEEITNISGPFDGFFVAKKNNKYGYINLKGEPVTDYQFNSAERFINGLARVNFDSYINTKGELVYEHLDLEDKPYFYEGFCVFNENGKWGVINEDLQIIIPPIYDSIEIINGTYLKVLLNNRFGIINKKHKVVLAIEYDTITNISNKFCFINKSDTKNQIIVLKEEGIEKTEYEYVHYFSNRTLFFSGNGIKTTNNYFLVKVKKNGKFGMVELQDNFSIQME